MNSKLTLIAAALLLSLSVASAQTKTVVLSDGSTATVLVEKGVYTTYNKGFKASTDGKVEIIQDQVFDGERLVKKADGQCFLVRERLLSLKDFYVGVGDLKIQLRDIESDSTAASCNS